MSWELGRIRMGKKRKERGKKNSQEDGLEPWRNKK
jgi:hypothetical protein